MSTIDFYPIKSVYISQHYAENNFSAEPTLFGGRYKKAGDVYRSLLQFGLYRSFDSLPADCIISRADLILTITRNEIPRGRTDLTLHQIWQAWLERTVTWMNQPLFSVSPVSVSDLKAGYEGPIEFDITELVQDWKKGTTINYGILIAGNEECNRLVAFGRDDLAGKNLRPRLELDYYKKSRLFKSRQQA